MQTKASHFLFTFLFLLSISLSILAAPTGITGLVKKSINTSTRKARSESATQSTGTSELHLATNTSDSLGKREFEGVRQLETPYVLEGYEVDPDIKRGYDNLPKHTCINDAATDKKKLERHRCKFRPLGRDNILHLEKVDSGLPGSFGELELHDGPLGAGVYGDVYDVRYWTGGNGYNGELVAKWFRYVSEGLKEIENLNIAGELVDWGYMPKSRSDQTKDSTSLWAIMKKKPGSDLFDLYSYEAYVENGNWETCAVLMEGIRKAIVTAIMQYKIMRGWPIHDDLYVSNVLFVESQGENGELLINAHFVDWGRMVFGMEKYETPGPDSEEIKRIEGILQRRLEKGTNWGEKKPQKKYDFSTQSQCGDLKLKPPS